MLPAFGLGVAGCGAGALKIAPSIPIPLVGGLPVLLFIFSPSFLAAAVAA